MRECNHKGAYLGLPFCKGNANVKAFQPLVDKLKGKLGGWKSKTLSQAGRSVLIKVVAQALPVYSMQTYYIPRSICNKLDSLM